jgi:hypothetical protein
VVVRVAVVSRRGSIKFLKSFARQYFSRWPHAWLPLRQAEYFVGIAIYDAELVRNEKYGQSSGLRQGIEKFVDPLFAQLVQARRRFAEQQHIRPAQQGKCNAVSRS